MLTVFAEQPECLWDDALPIEVKELAEDLAVLDLLLSVTSCCGRWWSGGVESSGSRGGWC